MKLCKAWGTCEAPIDLTLKDAQVWPKSLVESTVNRTVDALLKESFQENEDPKEPEIREVKDSTANGKTSGQTSGREAIGSSVPKEVWIVFGIFAFIVFALINSLFYKISEIEAWLHGRLRT
jgi:hypothetical protein